MILMKPAALKVINETTSHQIVIWAQRVEVQKAQKEVQDNIREDKELTLLNEISKYMSMLGKEA